MSKEAGRGNAGQRRLRVGEEMRHVLADLLGRGELRDPELQDRPVTVTEVRVSPDLKNATAFVIPLGGAHAAEVIDALRRSAGYLRGQIGHRMTLRHAPRLDFELDRSFDHAKHINDLLHRPDVQRDLVEPPTPSGDTD